MSKSKMRVGSALAAIAATVVAAGLPSVAGAREYHEKFSLEPEQDSRNWQFTSLVHSLAEIYGEVPVDEDNRPLILEAQIPLNCRNKWQLDVHQPSEPGADLYPAYRGPWFRKIMPGYANYEFYIELSLVDESQLDKLPSLDNCDISIRLYRPRRECSMSALMTGDLNGSYFGDVAYFNLFKEKAASNFMDPGQVAMLDQLMGGYVIETTPGEPVEVEGTDETEQTVAVDVQPWSFADEINQWAAEDDELPPGTDDRFHISLMDIKAGDGALTGNPDAESGHEDTGFTKEGYGELTDLESALAGLGGFSLVASSPGDELVPILDAKNPEPLTGTIALSVVRFKPGGFIDGNLEGIKFVGVNGNPGSAVIYFDKIMPNWLFGRIEADLLSERPHRLQGETGSRRLRVKVQTDFVALRGAYSCLRD